MDIFSSYTKSLAMLSNKADKFVNKAERKWNNRKTDKEWQPHRK